MNIYRYFEGRTCLQAAKELEFHYNGFCVIRWISPLGESNEIEIPALPPGLQDTNETQLQSIDLSLYSNLK